MPLTVCSKSSASLLFIYLCHTISVARQMRSVSTTSAVRGWSNTSNLKHQVGLSPIDPANNVAEVHNAAKANQQDSCWACEITRITKPALKHSTVPADLDANTPMLVQAKCSLPGRKCLSKQQVLQKLLSNLSVCGQLAVPSAFVHCPDVRHLAGHIFLHASAMKIRQ